MPVPIPRREPSHHVLKPAINKSDLQYLLHSIPDIPDGPPPAFSTRERWIDSLPPWRRDKLRHVDDERDDLGISLPKFLCEDEFFDLPHVTHEMPHIDGPMAMDTDIVAFNPALQHTSRYPTNSSYDLSSVHKAGHEPALLNHSRRSSSSSTRLSSDHDSSLQSFNGCHSSTAPQDNTFQVPRSDERASYEHVSRGQHVRNQTSQSAMAAESPSTLSTVAPSASPSYAKSCEALARWTAQYLWKVTTQGLSLPSTHVCQEYVMFSPGRLQSSANMSLQHFCRVLSIRTSQLSGREHPLRFPLNSHSTFRCYTSFAVYFPSSRPSRTSSPNSGHHP